mgnify:FL=1
MSLKDTITALLLALVLGCIAFAAVCGQRDFAGQRTASSDFYRLDIQRMTGTDLHSIELRAGAALQIRFETKMGFLHLEIKAPDGTVLYAGDGRETKCFAVSISQSGVYPVAVEAYHAKGKIDIQLKENT